MLLSGVPMAFALFWKPSRISLRRLIACHFPGHVYIPGMVVNECSLQTAALGCHHKWAALLSLSLSLQKGFLFIVTFFFFLSPLTVRTQGGTSWSSHTSHLGRIRHAQTLFIAGPMRKLKYVESPRVPADSAVMPLRKVLELPDPNQNGESLETLSCVSSHCRSRHRRSPGSKSTACLLWMEGAHTALEPQLSSG